MSDRQLCVLWRLPRQPIPAGALVLSFLAPALECELRKRAQVEIVSARQRSLKVRADAVESYKEISVRIGLARDEEGRTFRSVLANPGECSRWWFHLTSFKDSEGSPVLEWTIAILVIRQLTLERGLTRLHLCGASGRVAEVLRMQFPVTEEAPRPVSGAARLFVRGILSRLKFMCATAWVGWMARRCTANPGRHWDVAFTGFYDESLGWDAGRQILRDRYFKDVPDLLEQRGRRTGWFVWLKPPFNSLAPFRLMRWLAPLRTSDRVVALQRWVGIREVVAASSSFGDFLVYVQWARRGRFGEVFQWDGVDLGPIYHETLFYHFLSSAMVHCRLLVAANRRATAATQPAVTVSYLEHYLNSRALYEGVRRAGVDTVCVAMQHATVNREKTYYYLHPRFEYSGEPDGCAVPHPNHVCAMGELGQALFLQWGYAREQVTVTGCARFDYIGGLRERQQASPERATARTAPKLRLLIAASLADDVEIDLVEAVGLAAGGLEGFEVRLRKHPWSGLERHPRFAQLARRIPLSSCPLEQDILEADLVLFTYSTVAAEAFVCGKPTWMWSPLGHDASALAEVVEVPSFFTVDDLREALTAFQRDPARFRPTASDIYRATSQLFGPADGGEARRIAARLESFIGAKERTN